MATIPTFEKFGSRPVPRQQASVHSFRADTGYRAEERAATNAANDAEGMASFTLAIGDKFAKEDAEREARDLDVEYSKAIRLIQIGDGSEENPGYLNLKGEHAIKAREGHISRLDEIHKEIYGKASSARVQALVERSFASRQATAFDNSIKHFGAERTSANNASFSARIAALADEAGAANDPLKAAELAKEAGTAALQQAIQNGFSEKAAVFEAEKITTAIHVREIQRLAALDADLARKYFNAHKGAIDGRTHNDIETTLQGGEVKQWAMEKAGEISAAGGTLSEQLAKARKLDTTRAKKDETVARVKTRWKEAQVSDAAELDGKAQNAWNVIRAADTSYGGRQPDIDAISDPKVRKAVQALSNAEEGRRKLIESSNDKALFDALSVKAQGGENVTEAEMAGLDDRQRGYLRKSMKYAAAQQIDPDFERPGDPAVKEKFYDDLGDAKAFSALTLQELKIEYEQGVTKEFWENTILRTWTAARQSVRKAEDKPPKPGPSGIAETTRVKNAAIKAGIDVKDDAFTLWTTNYDRRVQAAGAVTNADKTKILDDMLRESKEENQFVYDKGVLWDNSKPLSTLTDDDILEFAEESGLPSSQHASFAENFRAIADSLRRQGRPINRKTVLKMWNEALARAEAASSPF